MQRHHDMGGLPAGPVEKTEHEFAPWEKMVTALLAAARARGVGNLDQMRRLVEDLPPDVYDRGYNECRVEALRGILVEHGIVTDTEIEDRVEQIKSRLTAATKDA